MAFRAKAAAIGLAAPGLRGWQAARAALAEPWVPEDGWSPRPACLPGRAARRVSPEIRLALSAAEEIAPALPGDAGWVFASSTGEGDTLTVILDALMDPAMMIQPVRFQNAVHNAALGQWTIAGGYTGPSTSIAGFDETAGAGLLKALMQVSLEGRAVGLVVYDAPIPEPLGEKRPMTHPMALALALLPGGGLTAVMAEGGASLPATRLGQDLVATGNPAARLLPLLEAVAGARGGPVRVALPGGPGLALEVTP